jgi:hypothetical protein
LLQRVRDGWPRTYTKSGLMTGLGETDSEVLEVLGDLRRHAVDIVTIGQYLSPGPKHLPVARFVSPEQFDTYRQHGESELGFLQVVEQPPHPQQLSRRRGATADAPAPALSLGWQWVVGSGTLRDPIQDTSTFDSLAD